LDALRLLVGRGGDPEKADYYGNTALHLAAAKGHMGCVSFLVSFGVNAWRQDIDLHTPQELAAMNDKHEILRYLDNVTSKIETEDKKRAAKEKEMAEKEAQKLAKNFKKVQAKAELQANKKEKKRQEWEKKNALASTGESGPAPDGAPVTFSSMVGMSTSQNPTTRGKGSYTSMVGTVKSKMMGTVFKKMHAAPHPPTGDDRRGSTMSVMSVSTLVGPDGAPAQAAPGTFKMTDSIVDGRRTVRSLSGFKRDNEVLFVAPQREATIHEDEELLSADMTKGGGGANRSPSPRPTGMGFGIGPPEDDAAVRPSSSSSSSSTSTKDFSGLFDRPGFGSVAFRRGNMASTLFAVQNQKSDDDDSASSSSEEDARHVNDEEDDGEYDAEAVEAFLAAIGLQKYARVRKLNVISLGMIAFLYVGVRPRAHRPGEPDSAEGGGLSRPGRGDGAAEEDFARHSRAIGRDGEDDGGHGGQ